MEEIAFPPEMIQRVAAMMSRYLDDELAAAVTEQITLALADGITVVQRQSPILLTVEPDDRIFKPLPSDHPLWEEPDRQISDHPMEQAFYAGDYTRFWDLFNEMALEPMRWTGHRDDSQETEKPQNQSDPGDPSS